MATGYEALDITDAKYKGNGILGKLAPFKLSCAKHDAAKRFRVRSCDRKKFVLLADWARWLPRQ